MMIRCRLGLHCEGLALGSWHAAIAVQIIKTIYDSSRDARCGSIYSKR